MGKRKKTSEEASQLADDYVQVRKQHSKETETPGRKQPTEKQTPCEKCGKKGHLTKNCWLGGQRPEQIPKGTTNYQQQRQRN